MEFDQASNFEENREFLSVEGCKETQKVTIPIQTFTMAEIIDYFIEAEDSSKDCVSRLKSLRMNCLKKACSNVRAK